MTTVETSAWTKGVGGSDAETELAQLTDRLHGCQPISTDEHQTRLAGLAQRMRETGYDAIYLDAGSNLTYYTGFKWWGSERLVGALIKPDASITYVGPAFETGTLTSYMRLDAPLITWEEHEDPYALCAAHLPAGARIGLDPATPLFRVTGLINAFNGQAQDAAAIILPARARKSEAELALMQATKTATLAVHQAAARILRPGISTGEVEAFIHAAHKAIGAPGGSTFCIVLFGPDTAFPHGVAAPKTLDEGDMVLIDTGCAIHGYQSDITRSYVFGAPTDRQRKVWEDEHACQQAAFRAAQLGQPCHAADDAARAESERRGYGPGYQLPGIPHRTGHGIGLDIHEGPYLVGGDTTLLDIGMCFSNEPMICVPGEFGIRLEDHFYMTADGPRWFTRPSPSIDNPFGL